MYNVNYVNQIFYIMGKVMYYTLYTVKKHIYTYPRMFYARTRG